MISSETPYKLAEIIRDTWPQLFTLNKIQNIENNMTFTVYSKDRCPYCQKIETLLEFAEVKYVVYKLDRDFTKEAFYEEYGVGATFPQVTFGDKHIGGCSDTIVFLREQKHLPKPE